MSEKRYVVELTLEERERLMAVLDAKSMCKQKRKRAQVLLMIDQGEHGPGWTDAKAVEAYHCGPHFPAQLRKRCVLEGFEAVLERKPQANPSRVRKLDEQAESELIAVAASDPPAGRARWTLRLLADELVVREIVDDSISYETVRRELKKTMSRPTSKRSS